MLKYSHQREIIRQSLLKRCDHPTADEIYSSVREDCPSISLGTVYRNLSLLADRGDILRINIGDGLVRFDGNVEPHYHFVCKDCGAVEDIFIDELPINKIADDNYSGEVLGHCTYFYGRCAKCCSKPDNK